MGKRIKLSMFLGIILCLSCGAVYGKDLSIDPLLGVIANQIVPKHRLMVTYMNKNWGMSSYQGSGESIVQTLPHSPEYETKMSDFNLQGNDDIHVFATSSVSGRVLDDIKVSPAFYDIETFTDVPRQVLVNTYFIKESKGGDVTSAWMEMIDNTGSIGRVKLSGFTPAYTLEWKADLQHKSQPELDANTAHDIFAYDWNNDGFSDYLISYIKSDNNKGRNPKAMIVIIDGKQLYNHLRKGGAAPAPHFVNGGEEFSNDGNIVGGLTDVKPANSYRVAIGDFDGDKRAEIALYFTKISGAGAGQSRKNLLRVYRVSENLTGSSIYELSGGAAGSSYMQNDSVGIAAGDFDNDSKDEIVLIYGNTNLLYQTSKTYMSILRWTGSSFSATVSNNEVGSSYAQTKLKDAVSAINTAVSDVDGDGYKELIWTQAKDISGMKLQIYVQKWKDWDISNTGHQYQYNLGDGRYGGLALNKYLKHSLCIGSFNYPSGTNTQHVAIAQMGGSGDPAYLDYAVFSLNTGGELALLGSNAYKEVMKSRKTAPLVAAVDIAQEGMLIGQPTGITIDNNIETLFVLQAPPRHWDIIKNSDGSDYPVDVYYKLGIPKAFDTEATYSTQINYTSTQESMTTKNTMSSGSFGASAGISVARRAIFKEEAPLFEAGIDYTYEVANSDIKGNTFSMGVELSTFALRDDQIYAHTSGYTIWRYPIIYPEKYRTELVSDDNGNTVEAQRFIQYVVPTDSGSVFMPTQGRNLEWYQPYHDNRNLFTYPKKMSDVKGYIGTASKDLGMMAKDLTGTLFVQQNAILMGDMSPAKASLKISESQHSEKAKSVKHTLSPSVNANIGWGKVMEKNINIKLNGDGSWGYDSTQTTDASKTTGISMNWPGATGYASASGVTPEEQQFYSDIALYTQDDGTFCTSYTINKLKRDDDSRMWGTKSPFHSKPDPALNLPMRWNDDTSPNLARDKGYVRGLEFTKNSSAADTAFKTSGGTPGMLLESDTAMKGHLRVFNNSFVNTGKVKLKVSYQRINNSAEAPDINKAAEWKTVETAMIHGRDIPNYDNWWDAVFEFTTPKLSGADISGVLGWMHFQIIHDGNELSTENNYGYKLIGIYSPEEVNKAQAASVKSLNSGAVQSAAAMPNLGVKNVEVRPRNDDGTLGDKVNLNDEKSLSGKKYQVSGSVFFESGYIGGFNVKGIPSVYVLAIAEGKDHRRNIAAGTHLPLIVSGNEHEVSLKIEVPEGVNPSLLKIVAFSGILHNADDGKLIDNEYVIYKATSSDGSSSGCNAGWAGLLLIAIPAIFRRKR